MNYTYLESAKNKTKNNNNNKTTTTTTTTNKKEKRKKRRTEQNRFIGQRSYAYHTHIPTTNTHTLACTGGLTKKGLIIN